MSWKNIKPASSPYHGIKGRTVVDHRLRNKLQLSFEAYCLMDYFHNQSNKKSEFDVDFDSYEYMGINEDQLVMYLDVLSEKGFIRHIEKTTWMLGDAWLNEFKDVESLFEQLWAIFPKGNKATALRRYRQASKLVSHQVLMERRQAYVDYKQSIKASFTYFSGLDVWLNVADRHWEDPLPNELKASTAEYKPGF